MQETISSFFPYTTGTNRSGLKPTSKKFSNSRNLLSLPTTRQSFVTPYLTWHGDTRRNSLVTLGVQAFAPRLWDKVNRANIAMVQFSL